MQKRVFTQEEKRDAVRLVTNDKKRVREVTDLYDLDRQTLHRWIKENKELGEKAFTDRSMVTQATLMKKQAREIEAQKQEIAILKKALAYVAKMKKQK